MNILVLHGKIDMENPKTKIMQKVKGITLQVWIECLYFFTGVPDQIYKCPRPSLEHLFASPNITEN